LDIFKFPNALAGSYSGGELIDGFKSKTWVERYREAGEFTLVADKNISAMRSKLPIGSVISHTDTGEVMIVETHSISESEDNWPELIITGSSFETILDNRIVGSNKTFPSTTPEVDYALSSAEVWDQIVLMVQDHILAANLIDDDNAFLNVSVMNDVSISGDSIARQIKKGSLYSRVIELLETEDLGIKVIRPGPWSPLGGGSDDIALVVHKGDDRSASVIFSYDFGQIKNADYLWTNLNHKNAALVSGKWAETFVSEPHYAHVMGVGFVYEDSDHYGRRVMFVDASDIDSSYTTAPTGGTLTAVLAAMEQRGKDAIAAQKDIVLTKAESTNTGNDPWYRSGYDTGTIAYANYYYLGDMVTVVGNYDEAALMCVCEHVTIEDENGQTSHPTFGLAQ
jgi:hypothetical protein